jgi:hypothetical protein
LLRLFLIAKAFSFLLLGPSLLGRFLRWIRAAWAAKRLILSVTLFGRRRESNTGLASSLASRPVVPAGVVVGVNVARCDAASPGAGRITFVSVTIAHASKGFDRLNRLREEKLSLAANVRLRQRVARTMSRDYRP